MSVQNFVPLHEADAEIFHCKSENFDMLVALEKSTGHQRIYLLGTVNVSTTLTAIHPAVVQIFQSGP